MGPPAWLVPLVASGEGTFSGLRAIGPLPADIGDQIHLSLPQQLDELGNAPRRMPDRVNRR